MGPLAAYRPADLPSSVLGTYGNCMLIAELFPPQGPGRDVNPRRRPSPRRPLLPRLGLRHLSLLILGVLCLAVGGRIAEAKALTPVNGLEVVPLDMRWSYQEGDDTQWAGQDFDDTSWPETTIPLPFDRRTSSPTTMWFRLTLAMRPVPRRGQAGAEGSAAELSSPLGLTLGKINSAYQIYAGGRLLGGVGRLPPNGRVDYDQHRVYAIPPEAIDDDGHLILALRVWRSPDIPFAIGPTEGPFFIGPFGELVRQESTSEFLSLFLAGLYLILGLAHFELFRRRNELRSYLWFALLASSFGLYGILRTQWKYVVFGQDFALLKEVELALVYLMIALFLQLLGTILERPLGAFERTLQGVNLMAAAVVLAVPGLWLNLTLLPFWQAGAALVGLYTLVLLVHQVSKGNEEAKILLLGCLLFALAFGHDVAAGLGYLTGGRWGDIGFICFVSTLALAMAGRFSRLHQEVESLRQREENAARANEAKTQFLANMSHEIRTPMTGILGAAELLLKSDLQAQHKEKAGIIRTSAELLLDIVDDILDFSKVETGYLELDAADFPLRETIEGVIDLMRPRARAKDIQLRLSFGTSLPPNLRGDALRLRQVLLNLIANGIKFTDRGRVELKVEHGGRDDGKILVRFKVEDTGIGISKDIEQQLFQPFTQADSSTTRRFGGTGLGLTISQRIVELMGGAIELESTPGSGSTFQFVGRFEPAKVRKVRSPATAARKPPPPMPVQTSSADESAQASAEGSFEVLLAEDNPVTRILVEHQLRDLGYRTFSAADGLEVLEAVADRTFDVILMDCQMPKLDGYDTTRRLRLREIGGQHVPVIAITAHAMEGERQKCLEAGMDDYLSKPFTQDQLAAVLERWTLSGQSRSARPATGEPVEAEGDAPRTAADDQ